MSSFFLNLKKSDFVGRKNGYCDFYFYFYVHFLYMLYCMENIEVGDQGDTINVYFCMERVSYISLR